MCIHAVWSELCFQNNWKDSGEDSDLTARTHILVQVFAHALIRNDFCEVYMVVGLSIRCLGIPRSSISHRDTQKKSLYLFLFSLQTGVFLRVTVIFLFLHFNFSNPTFRCKFCAVWLVQSKFVRWWMCCTGDFELLFICQIRQSWHFKVNWYTSRLSRETSLPFLLFSPIFFGVNS